ncbi:MAG: tRNA (adenosine(37)-N6)-dimethylallyltransferase MiaA [Acidobacteriota bacterium]|nr:MAG: tRNA (adenosine(37)-N6)-dimethylallyltransferase MiaA [Acidobacteriota bacterium]
MSRESQGAPCQRARDECGLPASIAIVGPTATGKTALALALADRRDCHLISCDAVQVFRHVEAATGKPRDEQRRHPWALIDWVEPEQRVDLGRWVRAAEEQLRIAQRAGLWPVIVGGTGLYLRGLVKGIASAPPRDAATRRRLEALAERRGTELLHRVLQRLDPASAARITPRDRQRLVRALEVRLLEGRAGLADRTWREPDRFPLLRIGLNLPRDRLYARIDRRVDSFMRLGLVEEVRRLVEQRRLPHAAQVFKALGYRETRRWLERGSDAAGLADLVVEIRRNTRRYAKRQLTWFRKEPDVVWFDAEQPGLVGRVEQLALAWYGMDRRPRSRTEI